MTKVNINGRDTDLVGLMRFVGSLVVKCSRCGRSVSKYDVNGYPVRVCIDFMAEDEEDEVYDD